MLREGCEPELGAVVTGSHIDAIPYSKKYDWLLVMGAIEATYALKEVYDVSSYMDEHPGGDDVLLAATGKDATDEFEDAGHSKSVREIIESFYIGELEEPTPLIPELEIVSKKQQNDIVEKLRDMSKQYWNVPVVVIGITVVASFLYSSRS